MTYRTRTATHMEEPLTIVCTHDMEQVTTDHGAGQRCRKCTVFHSDEWYSPAVIMAEPTKIRYSQPEWLASWLK